MMITFIVSICVHEMWKETILVRLIYLLDHGESHINANATANANILRSLYLYIFMPFSIDALIFVRK